MSSEQPTDKGSLILEHLIAQLGVLPDLGTRCAHFERPRVDEYAKVSQLRQLVVAYANEGSLHAFFLKRLVSDLRTDQFYSYAFKDSVGDTKVLRVVTLLRDCTDRCIELVNRIISGKCYSPVGLSLARSGWAAILDKFVLIGRESSYLAAARSDLCHTTLSLGKPTGKDC